MINESKYENLVNSLKELGSVVVAFSGGVDSTFLLKTAVSVLGGDKVIAVTAKSSTYPEREFNEAKRYAEQLNARHIVIVSEELDIDGFSKNPKNRCYYCKKELFSKIREIADENGMKYVLDGANFDDIGDFRPGMVAAREIGVVSPLKEAKLTKEDIRALSKRENIPTWNKPSFACLASRVPYNNEITREKLSMIEKAEQFMLDLGFRQVRVRHHGKIARIEVYPAEREKFFSLDIMDKVTAELNKIGFAYVTLDLAGYRSGSMNEVLSVEDKRL
jgi:pyridinium-3,5-biscarboxylic acid mononucleotide sulfurtransferase